MTPEQKLYAEPHIVLPSDKYDALREALGQRDVVVSGKNVIMATTWFQGMPNKSFMVIRGD